MFWKAPKSDLTRAIEDEVLSMCREQQIEHLNRTRWLAKDVGLEFRCGRVLHDPLLR